MTIKHDIDKLFKQSLSGYSEKPPEFVWRNVEQSLNKGRFKRKRNIMYSIAASVAILLSFGAGYMLTGIQSNNLLVESSLEDVNNNELPNEDSFKINNDSKVKSDKKNKATNTNKKKEDEENSSLNKSINKELVKPKIKSEDKPKSKVKKVSSSGILLPPMYAGANEYKQNEFSADNIKTEDEKEVLLINIDRKDINLMCESVKSEISLLSMKDDINYNNFQNSNIPVYSFNDKPVVKENLWSVGMAATPLISYREVVDVSSELVATADFNTNYSQEYSNEKPLTSYSVGINVGYKVSKRWKIQSGLYLSEIGQVSEDIALVNQPAYVADNGSFYINTSAGNIRIPGSPNDLISKLSDNSTVQDVFVYVKPTSLGMESSDAEFQADFVQTFEYFEIPVVVNYTIVDRKLTMNVSGGLSTNILYDNSTYVENNGSNYDLNGELDGLKSVNYSGVFGFGFEYPIVTRLRMNLQPTLRYALSSINSSKTVYPYSFGVYTGLKYNF